MKQAFIILGAMTVLFCLMSISYYVFPRDPGGYYYFKQEAIIAGTLGLGLLLLGVLWKK